jgi:uncharacterized protein
MSQSIKGFAFPFRIDPATGSIARSAGSEKLKENIKQILLTGVGERVMRRDFGGGVQQALHDPDNAALRAVVQHQIAKAITHLEPRVLLREVVVNQRDREPGVVWIEVSYVDREHQTTEYLSVQFGLG